MTKCPIQGAIKGMVSNDDTKKKFKNKRGLMMEDKPET